MSEEKRIEYTRLNQSGARGLCVSYKIHNHFFLSHTHSYFQYYEPFLVPQFFPKFGIFLVLFIKLIAKIIKLKLYDEISMKSIFRPNLMLLGIESKAKVYDFGD